MMNASQADHAVMVEIPVTVRVAVAFPDGRPADAESVAHDLALEAAQRLTHVSAPALAAFNEVNRVHPHGTGVVAAIECEAAAGP